MAPRTRAFFATTIVVSFATVVVTSGATDALPDIPKKEEAVSPTMTKNLGVLLNDSRAFPGYNLITPSGKSTYLYDNEGRVVHSWTNEYSGGVAYLLDNGHLFRTAEATNRDPRFNAVSNRIYSVQYSDGLNPALWRAVANIPAYTTNSRPEIVVDANSVTNRFYRLVTPVQ